MTDIKSVHMWGFFDDDGKAKISSDCAISELPPYEMWNQVLSNISFFDGMPNYTVVTRDLDGYFRGISFEVPPSGDGKRDRMWHIITSPKDPWPGKELSDEPTRNTIHVQ